MLHKLVDDDKDKKVRFMLFRQYYINMHVEPNPAR
jgi:hypothetical protein